MSIWRTDIEQDMFKLSPVSESTIQEAENTFNVKLPGEYIDILKIQNGGYIKFDSHYSPEPTSWSGDSINVEYIMGIGYDTGILDTPILIKEWDLPDNIILICGDGHSWVAFDYRNQSKNPPVIYVDSEANQIIEIAPSFKVFLNNLYVD